MDRDATTLPAPAFSAWLDRFFDSYYRHRPVNATFIGVHDYDARLPDLSPNGVADVVNDMRSLLDELGRLPEEPLPPAQNMDRKLAEGFLQIQLWEYGSNHFQRGNPSFYTGEAIFVVISLLLRDFAPLDQRVEAAISRMLAIPAFLEAARTNLREAPAAWIEKAVDECAGGLALFERGIERFAHDHGVTSPRLLPAANTAATAIASFQRFLERDLSNRATDGYACGPEAFDLYLKRGHFLREPVGEILRYAEERFSESLARLEDGAAAFGAADWQGALAGLADHHPSVEEYYERYEALWEACCGLAIQQNLLTWPDYPIRYVPRPVWVREAAPHLYFLFYRSPAPFDEVPVVEYLVEPIEPDMPPDVQVRLLRATNDSVIKLNHVVHHGSIGHHVQNWHAFWAASRIGQVAAVDCASRIAMFCGGTMAEGWSSYTTDLMDEAGFLTPLESYSLHHARLRMAARAIVDIRLHAGEFTLDEATAFYRDRVGMTPGAARGEAVKNSMFPGVAMMYLAGTDLIHRLRHELAGRYSLSEFHDRFLSFGSVPVQLVADEMREVPTS